ncbi:MAG TPA: DUF6677 family protein [Terriglobales bacterium]|nr:DUF6677 family protein [Terriglobales bacterium]
MPSETVTKRATPAPPSRPATRAPSQGMAGWWVVALGWLLPGLGYFVKRKWVRGALVFASVVGMFGLGLALRGQIYAFNTGDVLDILGWVGDICAGTLYFLTRLLGAGAGNPYSVMGDYGTKFLIAAGLLNLLAASDARDVFLGRKK